MPDRINVHLFDIEREHEVDKVYDTDKLHKATLATTVKNSPLGMANLKSKATKASIVIETAAPIDTFYKTDVGRSASIQTSVEKTPLKYSIVRSQCQRSEAVVKTSGWSARDAVYHTDQRNLKNEVDTTPIHYSSMKSNAKRNQDMLPRNQEQIETEYNTNVGNKQTISKRVAKAARKHKKYMRRNSARPITRQEARGEVIQKRQDNNSAFYETDDCIVKKTMYSEVLSSPIRYASTMRKDTAAMKNAEKILHQSSTCGNLYDTDQGSKMTLSKQMEKSQVSCSSMRSAVGRFSEKAGENHDNAEARRRKGQGRQGEGKQMMVKELTDEKALLMKSKSLSALSNDEARLARKLDTKPRFDPPSLPMYDTALGPGSFHNDYHTIQGSVSTSSLRYSIMRRRELAAEFSIREVRGQVQRKAALEEKGIRANDDDIFTVAKMVRSHTAQLASKCDSLEGLSLNEVSQTAIVPREPRYTFGKSKRWTQDRDTSKMLGSTFVTLREDEKAWNQKGVYMDKKLERSSLLPISSVGSERNDLNLDQGSKMTLETAVHSSPQKYSVSFKTMEPRLVDLRASTPFIHWKSDMSVDIGPGSYNPGFSDGANVGTNRLTSSFSSLGRCHKKFPSPTTKESKQSI